MVTARSAKLPVCILLLLIGGYSMNSQATVGAISSGDELACSAATSWPLRFEANAGQWDSEIKFGALGLNYGYYLTTDETLMLLTPAGERSAGALVRMKLVGAQDDVVVEGEEPLPSRSNYLRGHQSDWQTGVEHYSRVRYSSIYPGIDVLYYGNGCHIEYDFVVAPGSDPSNIRFSFQGVDELSIQNDGSLSLYAGDQRVEQEFPFAYQNVDGKKEEIEARYTIASDNVVSLELGDYDTSRELVIDPVLSYSSFMGGSADDLPIDVASSSDGSIYVAMSTYSADLPTNGGAFQPSFSGGQNDVWIIKLDSSGKDLIYATYFGGSQYDNLGQIAVDRNGSVIIGGGTSSEDFPIRNAFQPNLRGDDDGFIAKLNPQGDDLVFSTYIGGGEAADSRWTGDVVRSIAINHDEDIYFSGKTFSVDLPVLNARQPVFGGGRSDGMYGRLSPSGEMQFLSYIGGSGGTQFDQEDAWRIVTDDAGDGYISGFTDSNDFPTTPGAFQEQFSGGSQDAFLTKINPNGQIIFSTYLGGRDYATPAPGFSGVGFGREEYVSVAVGPDLRPVLTGTTYSIDFPTTPGAIQEEHSASGIQSPPSEYSTDAFLSILNQDGSKLDYSTYFGGLMGDGGYSVVVNPQGVIFFGGGTNSDDLPVKRAIQEQLFGDSDGFIAAVDPVSGKILFSSYLGGNGGDGIQSLKLDLNGDLLVVGNTTSPDFATVNAFQPEFGGGHLDGFVSRISDPLGAPGITRLPLTDDSDIAGGSRAGQVRGTYDQIYVRSPYRLGLLQFDASQVDGEVVGKATLRLYLSELRFAGGADSGMLYVRPVVTEWDESSVTWRTRPQTDDLVLSREVVASDAGQYLTFDITEIVQRWADGSLSSEGLQLETSSEITRAIFHSKENPSEQGAELFVTTGTAAILEMSLEVTNLGSNTSVEDGSTVPPGSQVQVTVGTNSVDCAGQYVVTALSESGDAPVVVQAVPYIIGPAIGSNISTGFPIDVGTTNHGTNLYKVSATCNGTRESQFSSAFLEFSSME